MQEIVANGFYNNDLLVVVLENEKFVVLEGNRRIAALKAILQPRIIPAFEQKIISLLKGQDVSKLGEIEVKVSRSRDEALNMISTVHTTQGRKPWTSLRQAYFYYAQIENGKRTIDELIAAYPGVNISTFITMWEMHLIARSLTTIDERIQRNVASRGFKITNLQRLYENENFREKLGIVVDAQGRVSIVSDQDEFETAFGKVVSDIVDGRINSRKMNKDSQIDAYLAEIPLPSGRSEAPINANSFKPAEAKSPPRIVRHLVPQSLAPSLDSPGVERRIDELKRLRYADFPNTSMDALRSLLECCLKSYCIRSNIGCRSADRPDESVRLHDLLKTMKKHLHEKRSFDLEEVVDKLLSRQAHSVVNQFNSANHNPHLFSGASDALEAWETIAPLVRFMVESGNGNDATAF